MATLHVRSDVRDLNRLQTLPASARTKAPKRADAPDTQAKRTTRAGISPTRPASPAPATRAAPPTPRVLSACRRINSSFYDHPEVIDAVVERILKALARG